MSDCTPVDAPAMRFAGVTKSFPGQKALDDVRFDIGEGRIHALIGHNGSGKSTLIKVLAGIYKPDAGSRVEVRGRELQLGSPRESRRRGLRFVHQDLGLVPELSAAENMALAWGYPRGAFRRIYWRKHLASVRSALGRLRVDTDIARPVSELRAVERTGVAIARALGEPEGSIYVLVLDEPTAALPPAEVDSLFAIVRDARLHGVSVVYVSHRVGEILALADEATILRNGVAEGTVRVSETDRDGLVGRIIGEAAPRRYAAPELRPGSRGRSNQGGASARFVARVNSSLLDGAVLELVPHQIVGILGLAGSGREEICEAIVGGIASHSKVVDCASGVSFEQMSPVIARRLGIALVLPNRSAQAAVSEFSIAENVSLPSLRKYTRGGYIRRSAEAALAQYWIGQLDIRPPEPAQSYLSLSGGNQQKTVFGKWLAVEPRALLLQDPTNGVDVGARERIYSIIRDQATRGLPVVIASADIEDLLAVCDRVLAMSGGEFVEEMSGGEISEARLLNSLNRALPGERRGSVGT